MKFENLYVRCRSTRQRSLVCNELEKNGYKPIESNDYDLMVGFYESGTYQYLNHNGNGCYGETLSFEQFMEKYGSNTMIEKINKAKKQLNFNNKQLSEALGYSRQYITKMLNLPQSEKIQDKVCKEIDALLTREKFKDVILTINGEKQDWFNGKDKDIVQLQKDNESLKAANSGLCLQIERAEKVHNEDVKALNETHSVIHVKNQRIEELERDIDGNNLEIKELNQAYIEVCDAQKWNKDRIVCERWLFLIIILILSAVVIFK